MSGRFQEEIKIIKKIQIEITNDNNNSFDNNNNNNNNKKNN